ncbi:DUF308 domain-containing protein [Glycomyces sp. NPDC047369]
MTERGEEPEAGGQEDGREGELLPEDVDRRFEELVRGLEDPTLSQSPEPEPEVAAEAVTPPSRMSSSDEEPGLLELWDADLPDDDEDDYDPPDPPPVPWPSLPAVGGVLLIVAGLALLVNPGIAPLGQNPGRLVGFVGFLIGVWLLISRLRPDKDADDTDDGAVV